MKSKLITTLAMILYWSTGAWAQTGFDVPAECKNLALLETQLLSARFHNNRMGDGVYNPAHLTFQTENGFAIQKIEFMGGDEADPNDPRSGKYPCDVDPSLCTHPADAGGAIGWAKLTVGTTGTEVYPVAEVVVSMGSRGGCTLSSGKVLTP